MKNFLIYGATGYTGQLITKMAVNRGLKPILAGRNEQKLKILASKYKLEHHVCSLDDKEGLSDLVLLVDVVLHCAGPFIHTYEPVLEACIKNATHYLDITGEIEVFERIAAMDRSIKDAGIMAVPGVGFDVVPTDCLAAYLGEQLPNANFLELAFAGLGGGISHGTAMTMIENLDKGGAVRVNGSITEVPSAHKVKKIIIKKKEFIIAAIPWGDVSTAYYTTGIPNIEVYMAVTPQLLRFMKSGSTMGWLYKRGFFKSILRKIVGVRPAGPSDKQRQRGKTYVWGQVRDKDNNQKIAMLTTPEGYTLTALTALAAVDRVLTGDIKEGFQTPSKAFGKDFILEIPGVSREDIFAKRKINVS